MSESASNLSLGDTPQMGALLAGGGGAGGGGMGGMGGMGEGPWLQASGQ